MPIAVWIVTALLVLVYLIAGGTKLVLTYERVRTRLPWTEHAAPWQVRAVGAVEVIAAIGLVLPPVTHILPVLAAVAAAGLVLVQVVAIGVHIRIGDVRRPGDIRHIAVNVVLLILALFVAIARFSGVA
jgi:hypothetical protein